MSEGIPLGKAPESLEERQKLIAEHLRMEEYLAHLQATHIQRKVIEFLITDRGYSPGEVEVNGEFEVELPACSFTVRADIMVRVGGRSIMAVKCVMNSLESWERHSVAFCRVAGPSVIPRAVVTDGETALLIDAGTCASVSGTLDLIPTREGALRSLCALPESAFAGERAEREKRILHAFEAIRCPAGPAQDE